MTRLFAILFSVGFFLAAASAAHATWETSIAIGGQFGGDVYYDPPDELREADSGFGLRLQTSYWVSDYFGFGPYLSYFGSEQLEQAGGEINIVETGISLRPRLPIEDFIDDIDLLISPNLQIGYRRLWDELEGSNGLALNLGFDFRLRWESGFSVFVEPGFTTQPAGGNAKRTVTFGPIGYAFVGVGYEY